MSKFSSKDIQAQYQEDVKRHTPIDGEKRREAQQLKRAHMEWLAWASWEEIEGKITEIGLLPGSPEYVEIRLLWKQVQQNLQKKRRK